MASRQRRQSGVLLAAVALVADLDDALRPAHGLDHLAALLDRLREGLLDVRVLPGADGRDEHIAVVVVRRGDDDGVQALAFEQAAVVGVLRRLLLLIGERDRLGDFVHAELGDVADGDDAVLELEHFADERPPAVAAADEADVQFLVRFEGARGRQREGDSSGCGRGLQESAARRRLGHG